MNENSFIYHKKGKKHISAVNRIKGAAPTIDLIDKEMLWNDKEEEWIWGIAKKEFIVRNIKLKLLNVIVDT